MTLAGALEAAEAAAPVESLDVVARMLKEHLQAASVSFLITDFTGSSVVRLGTADSIDTDEPPIGSCCATPCTKTSSAPSSRRSNTGARASTSA